jgi:hypothetical protein
LGLHIFTYSGIHLDRRSRHHVCLLHLIIVGLSLRILELILQWVTLHFNLTLDDKPIADLAILGLTVGRVAQFISLIAFIGVLALSKSIIEWIMDNKYRKITYFVIMSLCGIYYGFTENLKQHGVFEDIVVYVAGIIVTLFLIWVLISLGRPSTADPPSPQR